METEAFLHELGYDSSPSFLTDAAYSRYPGYSHVFRRAKDGLGLRGVYALTGNGGKDLAGSSIVPVVYVCEARSDDEAHAVHRKVWNQNVVPFLLVVTPQHFRLYSGFSYDTNDKQEQHLLSALRTANDVLDRFVDFKASAIDNGRIWDQWQRAVTLETRVDVRLLQNLEDLGVWLRRHGLPRETAHALIGKYVYLRYLKDRGILSPRKFAQWGLAPDTVFGSAATRTGLRCVTERLDSWLNGSIFPLDFTGKCAPDDSHVRKIAAIFAGQEVSGQMHLGFEAYSFEHIPIETLSTVYEQFLHAEGRGRVLGAYYTPPHLVSFMLDELDTRRRLEPGTRVFDPACGSGAFLVQCYRRMIERRLLQRPRTPPTPSELREILSASVFGVDVDADACGVTELSLILTLLDYVNPPDLDGRDNFKLPELRNRNVFCADVFDPDSAWEKQKPRHKFDLIVGNPPWTESSDVDDFCIKWMKANADRYPTGNRQAAEAFVWKATEYLTPEGNVGLLIPAMTLFKAKPRKGGFRREFFSRQEVWCVVNFANLANVLFAGRASLPAAALFFSLLKDSSRGRERPPILTYAPMVANQQANRPTTSGRQKNTWMVVINASEVRQIPVADAVTGDSLPWKLAMWGSARDNHLLSTTSRRFMSFREFKQEHGLAVHQGPEFRTQGSKEKVEPVPEVVGKLELDMEALRNCGTIFAFPDAALSRIDQARGFARVRSGKELPLSVCRPPHIIVDASRRFAVFSEEYLIVPPRQIGIAGRPEQVELLKALALYLSSDYAKYYQFFCAPEWGVEKNIATKETLEALPIPLTALKPKQFAEWADLQTQLAKASLRRQQPLQSQTASDNQGQLERELNRRVYEALGLSQEDRWLVHDLVHVRLRQVRGKLPTDAVTASSGEVMMAYARALKAELDGFVEEDTSRRHKVTVIHGHDFAVLELHLAVAGTDSSAINITVASPVAERELGRIQTHVLSEHRQWLYFNRGLRVYAGAATYLFKPLQRLYWLRSQALQDADEIIADKVAARTDEGN